MSSAMYYIASGILAAGILTGIYLMSKVKMAVIGNLLGSVCMAAGVLITLIRCDILPEILIWAGLAAGIGIGFIWAAKARMIEMPQTVALYNGFGGAASAIVTSLTLMNSVNPDLFSKATAAIALASGMCTLSGSLVAAGKLHKIIRQSPIILKHHTTAALGTILLTAVLTGVLSILNLSANISILSVAVLALGTISFIFGVIFTIRVGGADMPITISLLNSLSGVSGSIAGMAIRDPLLVVVGGIVGASGLLLTQIMCRAMNRALLDILLGKTSVRKTETNRVNKTVTNQVNKSSDTNAVKQNAFNRGENTGIHQCAAEPDSLMEHDNVIQQDSPIEYGIMIQHDYLIEHDSLIWHDPQEEHDNVILQNNPIKHDSLIQHDCPIEHDNLIQHDYPIEHDSLTQHDYPIEHGSLVQQDIPVEKGSFIQQDCLPKTENPANILRASKDVIIIPGYGMALAQAQHLVKELAGRLESHGALVRFAIHPVAGRMPGHMNVLLSEADIPYDSLYELEAINDEFENCDAAVIIGANDVVNPAARNAEGTPIYGMPILNADRSKHVIICNYDLKPGYAGVDNPLYTKNLGVSLLLGDAKDSLRKIIDSLQ